MKTTVLLNTTELPTSTSRLHSVKWTAACRIAAWCTLSWCIVSWLGMLLGRPAIGAEWSSQVVADGAKTPLYVRNSPQLVVSPRGRIHVVYVQSATGVDQIHLASSSAQGMQTELITEVPRSGAPSTGVESLALALDARQRPWVFLYTRDTPPEGLTFEELIASRTGGRQPWQVTSVRRSVKRDAGAGLSYPHLVIDRQQRFHVFSYVHNGFGEIHRVRHRFDAGGEFRIESLPRPAGKSDSGTVAAALDPADRIHLVYNSTKALRNGQAEPDYPSASLTYTVWDEGAFQEPLVVCPYVGETPGVTQDDIVSVGIAVAGRNQVHLLFVAGQAGAGKSMRLEYVRGPASPRDIWERSEITRTPPLTTPFPVLVTNPTLDASGTLHFAVERDRETYYWHGDGTDWKEERVAGELRGFALLNRKTPLVLTQQGQQLTLWQRNE